MMKKFLSVLLAGVLLLSMTAFATDWGDDPTLPQSKIYLTEDFSGYETIIDFTNSIDGSTLSTTSVSASDIILLKKSLDGSEGKYNLKSTLSSSASAFETNSFGKRTLRTITSGYFKGLSDKGKATGGLVLVPAESWDYIKNPDDIYIVSYDLETNPYYNAAQAYNNYSETFSFWTNDPEGWNDEDSDSAKGVGVQAYQSTVPTKATYVSYKYIMQGNHESGVGSTALYSEQAARMAFAYQYDEDALCKDSENGIDYIEDLDPDFYKSLSEEELREYRYRVPRRTFTKNGSIFYNDKGQENYTSVYEWGAKKGKNLAAWKNKTVLSAVNLAWTGYTGYEYSDIKMYTIHNDYDSFTVSIVKKDINVGDAAVVKFSHPVYHGSVTKDALSISDENGDPFTTFEIGEIKDVIDSQTKEVYTTAEILFPYGIKSGMEYTVAFNNAGTEGNKAYVTTADTKSYVRNELAWKLSGIEERNTVTFTTMDKPWNISSVNKAENLIAGQSMFTAEVTEVQNEKPSLLFIGVYNGDTLISYSYTSAKLGDKLSLATKIPEGYTVKAFCSGSVYDLSEYFGNKPEAWTESN